MALSTKLIFYFAFVLTTVVLRVKSQSNDETSQRCQKTSSYTCDQELFPEQDRISIEFATHTILDISYSSSFVDFTISFDNQTRNIRLVACGCEPPRESSQNREIVFINPTNVYVEDGPALYMTTELFTNEDEIPVKYVKTASSIYNPKIRSLIDKGKVFEMFNSSSYKYYESFFETKPFDIGASLVSSSPFNLPQTEPFLRKQSTNASIVPVAELNELSPLARAEWIKIIGLIFNRSSNANDIFSDIKTNYEDAKLKAMKSMRVPSVFFNYPYITYKEFTEEIVNYTWTQPGSAQFKTKFILDANADYRYMFKGQEDESNYFSIPEIVSKFRSSRFLLQSDPYPSRDKTISAFIKNPLTGSANESFSNEMKKLHAVRCGQVWSRAKREIQTDKVGALDFLESAIVRPDIVLKDFVKILHPYVDLGNHQLYYMTQYTEPEVVGLSCPYASLIGPAFKGYIYIDKKYSIERLTRFEIEDQLEEYLYPEFLKRNINSSEFEVQFRKQFNNETSAVEIVIRLMVLSERKDEVLQSSNVTDALKEGLREVNGTIKIRELGKEVVGQSSRGISTGAVIGIVVGCVFLILVSLFAVRRVSSRKKYKDNKWNEIE